VKVDLFTDPEFEFRWPETVSPEEQMVLKCKRLSYQARRRIEDGMMQVAPQAMERPRKGNNAANSAVMSFNVGTTKDRKIRDSVYDWENVLDPQGNPYAFSHDKLTTLISINCGLEPEIHGHLEAELLGEINARNNFMDQERPREGNLQTGSLDS
jgi:hypothetical protein